VAAAGKTDIGLVRSGNEDNFRIVEESNLFIVCDGMGGHQAGEVASLEACDIVETCFSELADQVSNDETLSIPADFPKAGDLLIRSIRLANRSIYKKAINDSNLSGMGTTIVAAVVEDNQICIAHVGDSRAYKMADSKLIRLTTDHSWVAELEKSGMYSNAEAAQVAGKNVITRALGVNETVEIDFRADRIYPGEIYLFCSDGLCGFAEDDVIFDAAAECKGDVQKICDKLVMLANQRGGQDNVTVVAIKIVEASEEPEYQNIEPVVISKESDTAIARENEIVDSIEQSKIQVEELLSHEKSGSGVLPFILVIIAIIVIIILIFLSIK
jgi:protein phosphatase